MFLSPTNALLYYTYKMLNYTIKISHDCSYMLRSIWTIIREPMPNLAKVTILCRYSVKIVVKCSAMLVKVFQAVVCTVCRAWHTVQTTAWNTFTNIAEHLTTYLYWISAQNCNFSKVRHRLADDGPNGPKHVEAIMRYFNCIF